jgi:glycosyltransferase involved in cell wall biosynthesis
MKIAVDARELTGQPTGVGRYLAQILAAWNDLPGAAAHEFILCTPAALRLETVPNLHVTYRGGRGGGTAWEQLTLPRLVADANVLFAPAYSGPLFGRVPMVLTIHDVSFAAHPEWFTRREGLRRRVLTRASAHRAARILTVSGFSKREIVKRLGVHADKVDVIYSGIHDVAGEGRRVTAGEQPEGSVRSAPAAPGPLVLYVGSIFNRRHVPELIAGFGLFADAHPRARLVIVGDNRTMPRADLNAVIATTGAAERISVREYIPDDELAGLYGEASVFAFLSDYEGFGFTPLEALSMGVPPVVLDTEVAREIYGPSAAYVPEPRPQAIAAGLQSMVSDEAGRQRILGAAAAVLQRYSWRECAQRTLQVLLACAS